MSPRRRKIMQLIAAGSVASLSGCVDVPRGGGGDGSSNGPSTNESTNQSTDGSSGEGDESGQSEDDEDSTERSTAFGVFSQQVRTAVDFLEWRSDGGYTDANNDYYTSIDSAVAFYTDLLDADFSNVSSDDISQLESELKTIQSVAYDQFGSYYRLHFNWSDHIPEVVETLENNIRRNEQELFRENVGDYRDTLESVLNNTSERYPYYNIGTIEPYERFLNTTGEGENLFNGFIFEGASVSGILDPFFITGYNNIRFDQNPFGIEREEQDAGFRQPAVDGRQSSLIDDAEWFSQPDLSESRYILNIVDYSKIHDSYPESYSHEDSDVDVNDVYTTNLNRCTTVGLSIQVFGSEDDASSAYEAILSQGTSDGTVEHHGIEYERVFFVGDEQTCYVSLVQVGEYILGMNPASTPWENIEIIYEPINSENVEYSLSEITSRSFLDPNSEYLDEQ